MQGEQQQQVELLPPGFRFFPTDEELITCYLAKKAMDASFATAAIRDVDLYKKEPWDLPCEQQAAAAGGDLHEGYFFCTRGSKSPSGVRARRATQLGYWKSTGKDKAVLSGSGSGSGSGRRLVGTRKTLVFYRGRAPRGEKTGWVMHEYAMGERSGSALLRGAQSEWVICRVFMRKQHPMVSDRRKQETAEEAVHDHPASPGDLLASMEPEGFDSQQEAVPPVVTEIHQHTGSLLHPGAQAMDMHGHDQHREMVRDDEELLMMNQHHGSSCVVVSPCWPLSHGDQQLGAHCSALPLMSEENEVDFYLPELLEYRGPLDTGGAEITSVGSSHHLDGLYWNTTGF